MRQIWLNKKNNERCILFFNGWGMDENAVCRMEMGNYDICMFNNYSQSYFVNDDFVTYKEVILMAWSLGVWASEHVLTKTNIRLHKKIAINGTSQPVNKEFGIPEHIFINTLKNWNELNREKFNARMMGGKNSLNNYAAFLSKRSAEEQKEELQSIYEQQQSLSVSKLAWDVAVVGQNDLIFSETNQINWWTGKTRIIKTEHPHFPFIGIESWKQITEY